MEPKLVDNVGDPEQVAKGKTKASILARRARDRWIAQLETPAGRAVIWQILEECRAFTDCFGRTDAETNRNTGKQSIGNAIMAWIHEARPNALVEMMLENAKEKTL